MKEWRKDLRGDKDVTHKRFVFKFKNDLEPILTKNEGINNEKRLK